MASKERHHLRDEAGSLFPTFELGGAEELTVASGGTAIAALVCRQSHTSSGTIASSRDVVSRKHVLDANNKVLVATGRRRFQSLSNLRAPLATLRLGLSPAKGVVSTINAHLPPPPPTQSEHIYYTLFLIISRHTIQIYSNTQYSLLGRQYLTSLQRHWPLIDIRDPPLSFVDGFLAAGSVDSFGP